jgi:hypothetical protein
VLTSTGALGTQADVVLFSIIRNNPERIVGAVGSLQDLNVTISRSKEKLIIVGNFEMMLNGYSRSYDENHLIRQNCSRKLANLVDKKYGDVEVSSRLSHYDDPLKLSTYIRLLTAMIPHFLIILEIHICSNYIISYW